MAASGIVIAIILFVFLLFSASVFQYDDNTYTTYLIIGGVAGVIGTCVTVGSIMYCSRRSSTKKNGFGILPPVETNPTPLISNATTTSNTYVRNEKIINTNVSPDVEHPFTSLPRKDSTASDYTESHYYTEIDEYFINKRVAKQQQKVQKRQESPGFQAHASATMASQVDNSNNTYDYVYGINPHLISSKQKNTQMGKDERRMKL